VWGSRPLPPALPPNKTMEGLFGGIAVTVAAAFGAAALFEGITPSFALWLAAIVIVLAPVGDLAESMVKRSLQLKDMGTILPGHGGVLDRIDAFLFILPGAWALSKVLGLIG
jgi:phosphatidate cytidylyltransferase